MNRSEMIHKVFFAFISCTLVFNHLQELITIPAIQKIWPVILIPESMWGLFTLITTISLISTILFSKKVITAISLTSFFLLLSAICSYGRIYHSYHLFLFYFIMYYLFIKKEEDPKRSQYILLGEYMFIMAYFSSGAYRLFSLLQSLFSGEFTINFASSLIAKEIVTYDKLTAFSDFYINSSIISLTGYLLTTLLMLAGPFISYKKVGRPVYFLGIALFHMNNIFALNIGYLANTGIALLLLMRKNELTPKQVVYSFRETLNPSKDY